MAEYMEIVQNIVAEVKKAVIGKDESIRKVMAFLCYNETKKYTSKGELIWQNIWKLSKILWQK